jgi:hypothetical protein
MPADIAASHVPSDPERTEAHDTEELLDRICERIRSHGDNSRLDRARRRHSAVMAWREPDYLPISFGRRGMLREEEWPQFDWAQQFHDPAKSLYEQLKGVLAAVAGDSDAVPSVRADTGVINCMTVFGARYGIPAHTKPVITEYVPRNELERFEVPDDVAECGVIPWMIEHMEHHLKALEDRGLSGLVSVRHCDQQGPFDIAAQTRGHEIFLDMHQDGEFVHRLMRKCTDVYVAVSRLCKETTGEPLDGGNVYGVWMENGGVRMCGDSDILVGRQQHEEFIQPYQQEAFSHFGGGWLHYCGGWKGTGRSEGIHLHQSYAAEEGLRGLNWTTAGDWIEEMKKLNACRIVHIGGLPRNDDEDLETYFRRALGPYEDRRGIIFQNPDLLEGEHERAMDTWHRVQDEVFG